MHFVVVALFEPAHVGSLTVAMAWSVARMVCRPHMCRLAFHLSFCHETDSRHKQKPLPRIQECTAQWPLVPISTDNHLSKNFFFSLAFVRHSLVRPMYDKWKWTYKDKDNYKCGAHGTKAHTRNEHRIDSTSVRMTIHTELKSFESTQWKIFGEKDNNAELTKSNILSFHMNRNQNFLQPELSLSAVYCRIA